MAGRVESFLMGIRETQMYKRFPRGSYARIKPGYRKAGHIVRIVEVSAGPGPSTWLYGFKVQTRPFEKRSHKNHLFIEMRGLRALAPLEILAAMAED